MKTEFVYGLHVVESLLRNQPDLVLEVWLQDNRDSESADRVAALAAEQGIASQPCDRKKLDKLTDQAVHQGIVARIRARPLPGDSQLAELIESLGNRAFLLFLDGVQDPHNLGACIRTAEAAGTQAVVFQKERAASLSPVARKAAVGAAERLPLFQVNNLARALENTKQAGIRVIGAAGGAAADIYSLDLTGPVAVVMGAEGAGIRERIRGICDQLVAIPMAGEAESLNVSVAAGVVLFEAGRQRHQG